MTNLCSLLVVVMLLGNIGLADAVVVLLWLSVDGTNAARGFTGSGLLAMSDEVLEVLYGRHLSKYFERVSCSGLRRGRRGR